MASSASKSKNPFLLFKTLFLTTILVIALFTGSCSATRPAKTMTVEREVSPDSGDYSKLRPRKSQTGFRFRGQTFNFFPKGTPVPPSGPSKRHNSAPQN
ncbi:Protein IDA-LIKE [Trema orientale]|uniref:Protein IDA-LIKE n=1 Tax=Trema orientale TaxID=63057 RepID=A0A2P5BLG3_TREOI|nr:Protein IDA-LIKE [Trema orientale]